MATCNVATLLDSGKDFRRLSDRDLKIATCQLLCEIQAAGTGGGTSCGAGAPVAAPSGTCGTYIDTNTGTLYLFYNAAWH